MTKAAHFIGTILFVVILAVSPADAQKIATDAAPPTDAPVKEESLEAKRMVRMRKLANSVKVYADKNATKQATLVEEPIFRWINPQRETVGGVAFVWVHQGRPLGTIGLWTYDDTPATDSYETQSLSATPFSTSLSSWSTDVPGVKFRPISNEHPPAATARRRLIQMRQLARKHFTATIYHDDDKWEPLRLLPTPVYRYSETPAGVIDGAMFSFAQGTDPEVFLILEAREADGKRGWHFAFGNQTSGSSRAAMDGKQIWSSEESKPTFHIVMRRP